MGHDVVRHSRRKAPGPVHGRDGDPVLPVQHIQRNVAFILCRLEKLGPFSVFLQEDHVARRPIVLIPVRDILRIPGQVQRRAVLDHFKIRHPVLGRAGHAGKKQRAHGGHTGCHDEDDGRHIFNWDKPAFEQALSQ